MVNITIYVEGGGDSNRLRTECHRGFREFFKKLGIISTAKNRINIEICGKRSTAFKDFRKKLGILKANEYCLLLVDSEEPITNSSAWQHVLLREGDKWSKPEKATDKHLHFMVECMEAWFMADKQALADYYGKDFNVNALPKNTDIESISKQNLYDSLNKATRTTSKGAYSKGGHSFAILSIINSQLVVDGSPYAKRLHETLQKLSTSFTTSN